MNNDVVFLRHILDAVHLIQAYTESGKDAFFASSLHQDGVIRQLEIIGEATKRLSEGLRSSHPEVPWRRMAALRDVLIHNYMGVDRSAVWNIVEYEIAVVAAKIESILSSVQSE